MTQPKTEGLDWSDLHPQMAEAMRQIRDRLASSAWEAKFGRPPQGEEELRAAVVAVEVTRDQDDESHLVDAPDEDYIGYSDWLAGWGEEPEDA